MRDILNSRQDTQQVMDRFKSFFFVVECKGFKLNVISDRGDAVMNKLKHSVPQMDWDYVLQRNTGSEVHMDVAFTYHPRRLNAEGMDKEKSGVMGLWRMDYLEESFGKGGFMSGTAHHLNTLAKFGALQAEMTKERSRRTHILNRISYNLVYEAVRKKDNDPWFCGDGDAYNLSETFLTACEEKQKQYANRGSRSYGVRDEYRVSGLAAIEVLTKSDDVFKRFKASGGVIYLPTHLWFEFVSARLSALEIAISYVGRKDPDNKGIVIGVLMNLIRSIESTPTDIPSHVRESKAALLTRAIVATHGMMFLHKLDLTDEGTETLPDVRQKDTQEVLDELKVMKKKRTSRPRMDPKAALSIRYPLGSAPTWNEVKETLKSNPLLLIRTWEMPTRIDHVPTSAGILFVKFTKSIWASIKSSCMEGSGSDLEGLRTLDDAMEFWSAHSIKCVLKDVVFLRVMGRLPGGLG
ncbi:hypothetical protein CVT26_000275 [Gymnopilus dilepis]|uniref:Uncharacterized protein n=1 Tax=Gymnopilus dilepis TaxID=231916 RepID=A0A409X942_9AGAR|nr:hypothetical protein CVT26_000275 [Gymnopilus dilepis]